MRDSSAKRFRRIERTGIFIAVAVDLVALLIMVWAVRLLVVGN